MNALQSSLESNPLTPDNSGASPLAEPDYRAVCADRLQHCTTRLWGLLQNWLGFRQGREELAMAQDLDKWARDSNATYRYRDAVDRTGHDDPAALCCTAAAILADARGMTFRQFARSLFDVQRDAEQPYDCTLPEPETLILAIRWNLKELRGVGANAIANARRLLRKDR